MKISKAGQNKINNLHLEVKDVAKHFINELSSIGSENSKINNKKPMNFN